MELSAELSVQCLCPACSGTVNEVITPGQTSYEYEGEYQATSFEIWIDCPHCQFQMLVDFRTDGGTVTVF